MQDNLSIIITMIIFVTLVVIFPLYNLFERQDDMSYTLALKATTSFVDEVRNNGYIDQESYDNFTSQLGNTGNSYDIQIEAHKKVLVSDVNKPGEYIEQYKIDYNADIFDTITTGTNGVVKRTLKNNAYLLNKDDQIYVKLKNATTTMAGAIFNSIIPTAKKDRIVVNYGGVIKNSSWNKVESTVHSYTSRPQAPVVTNNGNPITSNTVNVESGVIVNLIAQSTPSDWWKKIASYVWKVEYADGDVEEDIVTTATGTEPNLTGTLSRNYPITPTSSVNKVTVYAIDSYGEKSDETVVTINTYTFGPTKPTLSSNPDTINNNILTPIAGGNYITYTAYSTVNSVRKSVVGYVWTIRNVDTDSSYTVTTQTGSYSKSFSAGTYSVTVYAKDTDGLTSESTGTAFSIISNFAQQAISSVGLATVESIIIPNATISGYSFEVRVSSGHYGSDWWRIQGLTTGGVWESVKPGGALDSSISVSNGVSTGQVQLSDPYRYKQLRFQYSVETGHERCLTSASYIKYSVQYKF